MKNSKVYRAIARINRNLFLNKIKQYRLVNENFSIISNNCVGSLISHDLNQKFLTPTVNLFINTSDFVKFIKNLDMYLNLEIEECFDHTESYPVGKLGDIKIFFMHYKNIEEAKSKWDERKKRINRENLFVIMTNNDGCTESTLNEFKKIKYNKVFLNNKNNLEQGIDNTYIKGFEKQDHVGDLTVYMNILGKKYYDQFDYVNWLNARKG